MTPPNIGIIGTMVGIKTRIIFDGWKKNWL
jgi:hypothetical protein